MTALKFYGRGLPRVHGDSLPGKLIGSIVSAAKGAAILTVDALDMLLVAGLVLLLMRQVMPIAARLAGGVTLSSFGVASAVLGRGSRLRISTRRLPGWKVRLAAVVINSRCIAPAARFCGRAAHLPTGKCAAWLLRISTAMVT